MGKKVFVEKLNAPTRNNHIYTTENIMKDIVDAQYVKYMIDRNICFIYRYSDGELWYCDIENIIGRIEKFEIEQDSLYAYITMIKPDCSYPERLYLFGEGYVGEDNIVTNYVFYCCFVDDKKEYVR